MKLGLKTQPTIIQKGLRRMIAVPSSEEQKTSLFAWHFLCEFLLQQLRDDSRRIQQTQALRTEYIELSSSRAHLMGHQILQQMSEIIDSHTRTGDRKSVLPILCDLDGAEIVLSIDEHHSSGKPAAFVEYKPQNLGEILRVIRSIINDSPPLAIDYRYSDNSELIVKTDSTGGDFQMIFSSPLHNREYDEQIQIRWKRTRRRSFGLLVMIVLLTLVTVAFEIW